MTFPHNRQGEGEHSVNGPVAARSADAVDSSATWNRRGSEESVTLFESVGSAGRFAGLLATRAWSVSALDQQRLQESMVALRTPGVDGVCPLVSWSPERAWVAYAVPESVTVSELLATMKGMGCAAGVRAGVELLRRLVRVLAAADRVCGPAGSGHGALSAERVLLDACGRPHLMGYRLVAEGVLPPDPTAIRHAPPERVAGLPEDLSCDLFVAAMLSVELMVGQPVYAGSVQQVRQQASRGLARRRVAMWRSGLPESVSALLEELLQPEALKRPDRTGGVVARLDVLVNDRALTGPSLARMTQMALDRRRMPARAPRPNVVRLDQVRASRVEAATRPVRRGGRPVGDHTGDHTLAFGAQSEATRKERSFELFDSHRGRVFTVALDRQLTVAEAVSILSKGALPPVFSETGQLRGWYALRADRQRLSWHQRIGELDHAIVQLEAELVVGETVDVALHLPVGAAGRTLKGTVSSALPLRWALAPLCARAGVSWEQLTTITDGAVWVDGLLLSGLAPITAAATQGAVRIDVHPAALTAPPQRLAQSA